LLSQREEEMLLLGTKKRGAVKQEKGDALQGTLALMVLKTLDVMGPLHGFGIARRIEHISGDLHPVSRAAEAGKIKTYYRCVGGCSAGLLP
jgi:hypothetical protein